MAAWWDGNKTPRRGRTPFRWQQIATLDSNFNVWPVTSKSNKSRKTARTPALESRVARLLASLRRLKLWGLEQQPGGVSLLRCLSETRWQGHFTAWRRGLRTAATGPYSGIRQDSEAIELRGEASSSSISKAARPSEKFLDLLKNFSPPVVFRAFDIYGGECKFSRSLLVSHIISRH